MWLIFICVIRYYRIIIVKKQFTFPGIRANFAHRKMSIECLKLLID